MITLLPTAPPTRFEFITAVKKIKNYHASKKNHNQWSIHFIARKFQKEFK